MRGLSDLWVWRDPSIRERLSWYFSVSINERPAKYLICKRVAADFDAEQDEEELWEVHEEAARRFQEYFKAIRYGEADLSSLERPRKSLLDLKVELVKRMLKHCNFCRWYCRVDRSLGTKHGTCQLESASRVSSYFHHFGEELPIRGTLGSGTIFFTSCNMRCGFCQNGDISKDKDNGIAITPRQLALMMRELRVEGCHNVNLVGGEPTIHLHTIVEAISLLDSVEPTVEDRGRIWLAKADLMFNFRKDPARAHYMGEFNVPILWNSNMYMSEEAMKVLRELVDIWLPDFKFGSDKCSIKLARTPRYWETVTKNHKMIYEWGEDMVIRHLIMPNHVEDCSKPVLRWIAENMPDVPVNIMDQYHPDCFADPSSPSFDHRYQEIARQPTKAEILEVYEYARSLGLRFETLSWEKSVHGITLSH